MGANRTARTRPAQTEGHAPRLRISNAIYLIACSAYLYCARGTFYINHQRTEISTCTMQVQPGPAGKWRAYASPRRATRCAHQQAAPDNTTPRPPGPGQHWRCAAQLQGLASRVALARSDVQQVAQQPGARTIQREQRQALSLVRPTLFGDNTRGAPAAQPHGARPAHPSLVAPASAAR